MPLLSPDSDTVALHTGTRPGQLLVACLCVEWYGTCRNYRTTFTELARRHSKCCFVWVNVEDHADALGNFDVENFPTLSVQRGSDVLFSDPVLLHTGVVEELVSRDLGAALTASAAPDL